MFNIKPTFYYERSNKKLSLKKFGLMPGIPNDLLPRLKLVFSIFKNPSLEDFIDKAPSKMQNTIMPICDYLWSYKTNTKFKELDKFTVFFYYLCTKIQYDINIFYLFQYFIVFIHSLYSYNYIYFFSFLLIIK